jgi:DNA polymerase V
VLDRIYRGEFDYKKAGVMLSGIEQEDGRQLSLFRLPPDDRPGEAPLMAVMDRINRKWGSRTMEIGAVGVRPDWKMRREKMSPRYTTSWEELPTVRA